jgi:hypothetical protein
MRLREIGTGHTGNNILFSRAEQNYKSHLKLGIFTVDDGIKEIDRLIKEGVIDA